MADIIEILLKGGWIMVPLCLCSLISVAIFVERFLLYRELSESREEIFLCLQELNSVGDWKEQKGASARLIRAFMEEKAKYPFLSTHYDLQANALQRIGKEIVDGLKRYIDYLESIVTLAPLLGLLGTIIGMMSAFNILSIREGANFEITGGISEALIATGFGLGVAILAYLFHLILVYQCTRLISDLEWTSGQILQRSWGEVHEAR